MTAGSARRPARDGNRHGAATPAPAYDPGCVPRVANVRARRPPRAWPAPEAPRRRPPPLGRRAPKARRRRSARYRRCPRRQSARRRSRHRWRLHRLPSSPRVATGVAAAVWHRRGRPTAHAGCLPCAAPASSCGRRDQCSARCARSAPPGRRRRSGWRRRARVPPVPNGRSPSPARCRPRGRCRRRRTPSQPGARRASARAAPTSAWFRRRPLPAARRARSSPASARAARPRGGATRPWPVCAVEMSAVLASGEGRVISMA